jgi:excisionase family DNA binding protein
MNTKVHLVDRGRGDARAAGLGVEGLLTFGQAAEALGISLRQFRRLVESGKVAFVRLGERTPRVRPSELRRLLDESVVKYADVVKFEEAQA